MKRTKKKFLYPLIFLTVIIITSVVQANSIFKDDGKHMIIIGAGHAALFNNYGAFGADELVPVIGYSYAREHTFFTLIDFHAFKNKSSTTFFSSKALTMAFGYNFWQLDSFYFSFFGGLGFYQPKASRSINSSIVETSSKLVFGTNIGVEALLKFNQKVGYSMRFHYHNPFDISQDQGGDLKGHYTILSANILVNF